MQTNLLIILGITVPFISLPAILPFFTLIPKIKRSGKFPVSNHRYVALSTVVLLVVTTHFLGISFQSKHLNLIMLLIAASCYLILLELIFQFRPRFLAVVLGIVTVLFSGLFALGSLLSFAIDGETKSFELTRNLYCEVYQFGFAGSQGGLNVTLYRKVHVGLSHKVFHEVYLDEIKQPFNTEEGACKYAASIFNG